MTVISINKPIGICLGDVTGIGPEVTLKALKAEFGNDQTSYVIFGDSLLVKELNSTLR